MFTWNHDKLSLPPISRMMGCFHWVVVVKTMKTWPSCSDAASGREGKFCLWRASAADAQDWQMFGLVKWGGVEYLLEDTLFPSPGLAPSEWYRGRSVYYCLIIQINSNWCQLLQPWLVLRKTSCKTLPLSIKFCCPTVQIAGLGKLSFRNKLGDAIVIFKSETKFGGWGHKNIL